jgi:hypothetical protein
MRVAVLVQPLALLLTTGAGLGAFVDAALDEKYSG